MKGRKRKKGVKEEKEGRKEGRNEEGKKRGEEGKVEGKKTRISKAVLPRTEYFCLKDGYDADSRLKHLNTLSKCLVLQNSKNIIAR